MEADEPACPRSLMPGRPGFVLTLAVLVDCLPNTPAIVVNDIGDITDANVLARELFSEYTIRDNLVRMTFLDPAAELDTPAWRDQARDVLATLRRAYQQAPSHSAASALLSEMLRLSAPFRTMWLRREWSAGGRTTRVFHHRDVGPLVADEVLLASAAEPGRNVLVYVAAPGSSSDHALRLLGSLRASV